MELAEPPTVKAGYTGIDYKLVPVHQLNPDYYSYKEILDKQEVELRKIARGGPEEAVKPR